MHLARIRVGSVAFLTAIAATFALSASAGATPSKPYSVVICALGSSETCAPTPTWTADRPAGVPGSSSSVAMTATFSNLNGPGGQQIGSANLDTPAGFTVTTGLPACPAALPQQGPPCAYTVAVSGGTELQLRDLAIPSGGVLTVNMSASTPDPTTLTCGTVLNRCPWSVSAKQSNDFSSTSGGANLLSLDPARSTLDTVLAHLAFGVQPASARIGQTITSNEYASGDLPTTNVVDSTGVAVLKSYVGQETMNLITPNNPLTNPVDGTLGPAANTQQNATDGTASWSLNVNLPGNGYALAASAAGFLPPDPTSSLFDIQQDGTPCDSGKSCKTEATSPHWDTTDQGVDVKVNAAAGNGNGRMGESIDFGSWSKDIRTSECGAASEHFAYSGLTTTRMLSTSITTTESTMTKSTLNSFVSTQQVCLAQTSFFMARDDSTKPYSLKAAQAVTLPDGTQGYAGEEPDCGTKATQVAQGSGPCVTGRTGQVNKSGTGGTVTITDSAPFDRWTN